MSLPISQTKSRFSSHALFSYIRKDEAQAALGLVFLVGGLVILLGVSLAYISFTFLNSSTGYQSSQRASALANTGISDAIMQLNRNKDYGTSQSQASSTLIFGSDSVYVTVARDTPTTGLVTITGKSTVAYYTRTFQAVVSVDSTTGEVATVSWKQIANQ